MVCFVHFDLKMHFAPQRLAIFHVSSGPHGSAPAALASLLFDPPEPQIIEKNTAIRDRPNISRVCIFFLLTFAQLYLLSSCSTSLLCFSSSDSTSLPFFSTLHIVGSFTSMCKYLYIQEDKSLCFLGLIPTYQQQFGRQRSELGSSFYVASAGWSDFTLF